MKIQRLLSLAALLAAFAMTGCWQKSIKPFHKADQVIFDEALLGEWRDGEASAEKVSKWVFTRGAATNTYQLHVEDDEVKLDFDVHMFKMGEGRFLNFFSRHRGVSDIPSHHLFRVVSIDPVLKIQTIDISWMGKWLQANPNELPAVFVYDVEKPNDPEAGEYILHASTEQLQKFVLKHLNEEGFWSDSSEMRKHGKK